ncbi:MAG: hypothetical protein ABWY81_10905 [Jiangellaceae bacterium]
MTGAGALLPKQLCPYIFCDVQVSVIPTLRRSDDPEMVLVIEDHPIGHPILTGPCVMSGMQLPLSLAARGHVTDRERTDSRTIHLAIRDEAVRNEAAAREQRRLGRGPWSPGPRPAVSQEMGGRPTDPGPMAEEWALGGRQDEDVVADPVAHENEPHVGGTALGRAGEMATLDEVIGVLRAANESIGESMGALNETHDKLHNALNGATAAADGVRSALGDMAGADTLGACLARVSEAGDKINAMLDMVQDAQQSLAAGEELASTYIANMN